MAFVTAEHIRHALAYLGTDAHSVLISLLAAWRNGMGSAPSEAAFIKFGASQENELLAEYFAPPQAPADRPFYVPFGDAQGKSRWRDRAYAGSSLQRQRKDRRDVLVQKAGDRNSWAFAENAVENVAADPRRHFGEPPLSLPVLGAWLLREEPINSLADLSAKVVTTFKIPAEWIDHKLFTSAAPASFEMLPLGEQPLDEDVLRTMLQPPPTGPRLASSVPQTRRWSDVDVGALEDIENLLGMAKPARQALAALKAGKHVVFTGAPGTGKTSLAVAIFKLAGQEYTVAPATDAWTTFETIGGYFPMPSGGGVEGLDFHPGVIVASIETGKSLIIDELNRADIDKAFGEMFTLLAGESVSLPYQRRWDQGLRSIVLTHVEDVDDDRDQIVVPPEWRLIATMNDADKASLKRLSLAFVRRFAFVPINVPAQTDYTAILESVHAALPASTALDELLRSLVAIFANDGSGLKSIGFPVGPAIPKSMLEHSASEIELMPAVSGSDLLESVLSLYLAPQLQGRPDLHQGVVSVVAPLLSARSLDDFKDTLAVWTGYA